jgi:dTDP-glucose 4,6-dehydratase
MDISRISSTIGWRPSVTFAEGLRKTVAWYLANEAWWRTVQNEAYRASRELYLATIST